MMKRYLTWIVMSGLFSVLGLTLLRISNANAQQQFPIMDKIAEKVIQKYEQSSCQQLQQKESQKTAESSGNKSNSISSQRPTDARCIY